MSKFTLTDCGAWLDGYSIAGDMNQMSFSYAAEELDGTTFGSGARNIMPGFLNFEYSLEGLWEAGTGEIDTVLDACHAVSNKILTFGPETGAAGKIGYSTKKMLSTLNRSGQVGELFAVSASGKGSGSPLVRGTIMENGAKTTSTSGTIRNLGAVTTGQSLYAVLHVIGVSGTDTPTITVKVQSDALVGFASPTDVVTFTAATAIGAQWVAVPYSAVADWAGDAFWRASWTVSGTNPSLEIVCLVGIL